MENKISKLGGVAITSSGLGLNIVGNLIPQWIGWTLLCMGPCIFLIGFIPSRSYEFKSFEGKAKFFYPIKMQWKRFWKRNRHITEQEVKPQFTHDSLENLAAQKTTVLPEGVMTILRAQQAKSRLQQLLNSSPHAIEKVLDTGAKFGHTSGEGWYAKRYKNSVAQFQIFRQDTFDIFKSFEIDEKELISEIEMETKRIEADPRLFSLQPNEADKWGAVEHKKQWVIDNAILNIFKRQIENAIFQQDRIIYLQAL